MFKRGHGQHLPTPCFRIINERLHCTKHIDIQYFYTCNIQDHSEIYAKCLETNEQLADIFVVKIINKMESMKKISIELSIAETKSLIEVWSQHIEKLRGI